MPATILGDVVVTPTKLNRRAGDVLKEATKRPVTVTAKGGDLVILRRDLASRLFEEEAHFRTDHEVMTYFIERCFRGRGNTARSTVDWLDVFDDDDLLEFKKEYTKVYDCASEGLCEWSDLDDVLHEWKESAKALNDQYLQRSIKALREKGVRIDRARAPQTP